MGLFLVLAAVILGVPLFSTVQYLRVNARAGQLPRVRELCGGRLLVPVLRAFLNTIWSIALAVLAYPLGWLPQAPLSAPRSGGPGGLPPVLLPPIILVHGLYHNASAWLLFRRRLARAGFADVRAYAYPSFFRPFEAIAGGLVDTALRAAAASPTGRVLLVGHSLGGLVIRAACAHPGLSGRVAGVVTLGTPHQGSALAGLAAVGRLGRGLAPGGCVLDRLDALPVAAVSALSLYTPTDGMVLPLSGSLLEEREKAAGWTEVCLPPLSHVGLLYDRAAAGRSVAFLLEAAGRG